MINAAANLPASTLAQRCQYLLDRSQLRKFCLCLIYPLFQVANAKR